jgi:dihydrolipoamide dehydrogenase
VKVTDRGFVEVDELLPHREPTACTPSATSSTPQLAHVGYAEAILVTKHILGEEPVPGRLRQGAVGIYCHPEVAFAGPRARPPRDAGYDVSSPSTSSGNSRAQIIGELDGLVKVIAKKRPTARPARSSACTWWARGSPSSSAATSPSTGRPRWPRSPSSSSRTRRLTENFGETVLSLTGRSLNA